MDILERLSLSLSLFPLRLVVIEQFRILLRENIEEVCTRVFLLMLGLFLLFLLVFLLLFFVLWNLFLFLFFDLG